MAKPIIFTKGLLDFKDGRNHVVQYTNPMRVHAGGEYLGNVAYFSDMTYRRSAHPGAKGYVELEDCIESMLRDEFGGRGGDTLRDSVTITPRPQDTTSREARELFIL